jgi:hypothetical protein
MKWRVCLDEFALFMLMAFVGVIAVSFSFGVDVGIVSSPIIFGSFVVAMLFALKKKADDNVRREATEAKAIVGALAAGAGKKPLSKSLIGISNSNGHYLMAKKIRQVGRRLQLGEELGTAVKEARIGGSLGDALQYLVQDSRNGIDSIGSLNGVNKRLGYGLALDSERRYGSLQRNLTLLMVVGTVIPSLFLFLFTGYAMVNGSLLVIVSFSVFICGIIPSAYFIASLRVGV